MTEILVAGATGLLGSRICRSLVSAGHHVRALVRPGSEERLGDLRGSVEVVHGDLRDRASLDRACRGVQVVVSGVTAILAEDPNLIDAVDRDGNVALIDAAADAGVERFVFVSIATDIQGDYPLGRAKRDVEQALGASGLTHTIVQPACFMEVWLGPLVGLDVAAGRAQVFGSGEEQVSYVAVDDVAQAVAAAAGDGGVSGVLSVPGPPAMSQRDAIAAFEQAAGREFEIARVPREALDAAVANAADQRATCLASLMRLVADGRAAMPQDDAAGGLGIRWTTVEEFARSSVAAAR